MPAVHSTWKPWRKMSAEVMRLADMWFHDDGMSPSEIAELLHRDKSTLTRYLVMRRERKIDGRPRAFTEEEIDRMVKKLEDMIIVAKQEYRVTAAMLKNEFRLKASTKRILEPLRTRDIYSARIAGSL